MIGKDLINPLNCKPEVDVKTYLIQVDEACKFRYNVRTRYKTGLWISQNVIGLLQKNVIWSSKAIRDGCLITRDISH